MSKKFFTNSEIEIPMVYGLTGYMVGTILVRSTESSTVRNGLVYFGLFSIISYLCPNKTKFRDIISNVIQLFLLYRAITYATDMCWLKKLKF